MRIIKMPISILRTLFPKFHPLKHTVTDSHPVRYKFNFPFAPVSTTLLFYVISAGEKKKRIVLPSSHIRNNSSVKYEGGNPQEGNQ